MHDLAAQMSTDFGKTSAALFLKPALECNSVHATQRLGRRIMNTQFDRITVNPEIMNGQPCIRGMRLTVRRVVQAAAVYPDCT